MVGEKLFPVIGGEDHGRGSFEAFDVREEATDVGIRDSNLVVIEVAGALPIAR